VTSRPLPIDRLAELCHVETRFRDARGQEHTTPPESTEAILAAMKVPAGSEAEIREAIAAIEDENRRRLIPEAIIVRQGSSPVLLPKGAEWRLEFEDGGGAEGAGAGGVNTTGLPIGVHRLTVTRRGRTDGVTLLASPRTAPDCRALTGRKKLWGVAAPLYGLRSAQNLGLGTYGDLAELAEAIGPMGADYLAINPVHALFPLEPRYCSPYSPTHRRFFNTAHIDARAVPEFAASEAAQRWLAEHGAEVERLRGAELIDYPAVAALLQPLLERLFETFEATCPEGSSRAEAFADWCRHHGAELDRFATHQALSERFGLIWHDWPEPVHHPEAPEVAVFAADNAQRIRFHKYLQWLASDQLDTAQSRARAAGMGLGLVADLAVGVSPDGAETWGERGLFASGASLGAPPDAFNSAGQNWNLAPFRPDALRRDTYRAFSGTLAQSMRWSGAIRIDHMVGFRRGYWIPDGHRIGAYVQYPVDEMLAVAAIEGHHQNCLVIGEDLGNVPPGLRDRMDAIGILGCRLVYFKRERNGPFTLPKAYRYNAAASIGSHDSPSFREWWRGADLAERLNLGVIDATEAESELALRATTRKALLEALRGAGIAVDGGDTADDELVLAIHRFLAVTGSALATVQAENAFGLGQLNVPGTTEQYPNWRRRMPLAAEWRTDPLFGEIAQIMLEQRPRQR